MSFKEWRMKRLAEKTVPQPIKQTVAKSNIEADVRNESQKPKQMVTLKQLRERIKQLPSNKTK